MGVGTTTALIASAVIAAGATGVSANQAKKQAGSQANRQRDLAKKQRTAQVAQQEAESQRARDTRAVEQAALQSIEGKQLQTQGISESFGSLDVGALGRTSANTAASTLNPIQPDTGA